MAYLLLVCLINGISYLISPAISEVVPWIATRALYLGRRGADHAVEEIFIPLPIRKSSIIQQDQGFHFDNQAHIQQTPGWCDPEGCRP